MRLSIVFLSAISVCFVVGCKTVTEEDILENQEKWVEKTMSEEEVCSNGQFLQADLKIGKVWVAEGWSFSKTDQLFVDDPDTSRILAREKLNPDNLAFLFKGFLINLLRESDCIGVVTPNRRHINLDLPEDSVYRMNIGLKELITPSKQSRTQSFGFAGKVVFEVFVQVFDYEDTLVFESHCRRKGGGPINTNNLVMTFMNEFSLDISNYIISL